MELLIETHWRFSLPLFRLVFLLGILALIFGPTLALAMDEGEAYEACKAEEAYFGQYETIFVSCYEFVPHKITYGWQGSGPPHTGTQFSFDAYCSTRANATALVSSAPPSVMCQIGCTYSASGQIDTLDGPAVVYDASGGVCPKLATVADPDKNLGPPCAGDCPVGDPLNAGTGNKYESKTEFRGGGVFPLEFTWYYNSMGEHSIAMPFDGVMGSNRTHSYSRYLSVQSSVLIYISQVNGSLETYRKSGSNWIAEADNTATLQTTTGQFGELQFQRKDRSGEIETYLADGRLLTWMNRDGLLQTLSYNSLGLVATVTDPGGRVLGFRYDSQSRLSQLDLPDGNSIGFLYDSTNYLGANLSSVVYPGGSATYFLYNEPGYVAVSSPHALTGVVDESGNRYSSTTYDVLRRATSTYLGSGVDTYSAQYIPVADRSFSQSTILSGPLGAQETRTYQAIEHRPHQVSTSVSGAGVATRSTTTTYDLQGRLDTKTDALGSITDFDFDARGRLTSLTAAKNDVGNRRTIQTDWHAAFNVPTERRTLNAASQLVAKEMWSYNSRGQVATASIIDVSAGLPARTSQFSYCEVVGGSFPGDCPFIGLLTSIDGSRTDIQDTTSFSYYYDQGCSDAGGACWHHQGDLWKVTNQLGQVTEFMVYDDAGRPIRIKDANGIVTDLEYTPRGWLAARKIRGVDDATEVDDAITTVEYWPTGDVKIVTLPDGVFTSFEYDAAHRLTDVADSVGNSVHYTLDNAGNRAAEQFKDARGTLRHSLSRVFNGLNELKTLADAASTPTDFTYDANGALDTATDPLGRITDNTVDPLGRLLKVIANTGGSASDKATSQFEYDARDLLTAVVDPKGLRTEYNYNGFGELIQINSPDTQVTTFGYDAAGNRIMSTDARGKQSNFTYDGLGRITGERMPAISQNVVFDYDRYWYAWVNDQPSSDCSAGEQFGIGRLGGIVDESGSTRYCYDRRGNIVRKVQKVTGGSRLEVGATFNGADKLIAMTYPSGAIVTYLRNANGQVSRVDAVPKLGQAQVTLVSASSYLPFGPLNSLTFGNGRTLAKAYDADYRIDKVSDSAASNPISEDFTLDIAGNLTVLAEITSATTATTRTFSHDGLDRVTGQKNGTSGVEGFNYDATGNRLSKILGNKTTNYSYPASNHRLSSVGNTARTYDAAGNTVVIGSGKSAPGFNFDDRNRLRDYKLGTTVKASYRYNGGGERVLRIENGTPANSRQFVYDETGRLLGEYTTTGARIQEYVWLDDTLVAILSDHDASSYQYVETDHLGTPRAVIHPVKNTIIWRWDLNNTTFGDHAPIADPDGNRLSYTLNLRYPGQVYDATSGMNYNYFRDYDPATGRYIESDPIGLQGGFSTYAYAEGSPMHYFDPIGLWAWGESLPQGLVDTTTGFGAGVVRGATLGFLDPRSIGIDEDVADRCSGLYGAAEFAGSIHGGFTLGAGLGIAGKGRKGWEFSHFLPARWIKNFGLPRSIINSRLNGTYVPWAFHAVTDTYRYRFVPRSLKALIRPLPNGLAQLLRMPPWMATTGFAAYNSGD